MKPVDELRVFASSTAFGNHTVKWTDLQNEQPFLLYSLASFVGIDPKDSAFWHVGLVYFLDFLTNYLIPFLVILVVYHQFRSFYYQRNGQRLLVVNLVHVSGLVAFGIGAVGSLIMSISARMFVQMYTSSVEIENRFAVTMYSWLHEIILHGAIGIIHSILGGCFFIGVGYCLIQDFKKKLVFGILSLLLGSAQVLISCGSIYRNFLSTEHDESFLIVPSIAKSYMLPAWVAYVGYLLLVQKEGTLLCFQQANADLPPDQRNQSSILDYMKSKDD